MKAFSTISIVNIVFSIYSMQVPTLKMLAAHAVVVHDKKDESKCPKEVNDEIILMELCKADPSKAMENAINTDNNNLIDFLLYKKAYIANEKFEISEETFTKVMRANDFEKVKKWFRAGINLREKTYSGNASREMSTYMKMNVYALWRLGEPAFDTRLMGYCRENNLYHVKQILTAGAHVNARNFLGFTALHCASTLEIMKCLIDHGADLNVVDGDGRTVLEKMIKSNKYDLVKLLIDSGASIKTLPSAILAMVPFNDLNSVIALLKEKGAQTQVRSIFTDASIS